MKKFFLVILTSVLLVNFTQAQGGRSTICANAGFSLVSAIFGAASGTTKSLPAIQLTYDFAPVKWVSIGVAASLQKLDLDVNQSGYVYSTSYTRTNIAGRILFNYGPSRVRMYTGIRIGTTMWKYAVSGTAPSGYDPSSDLKSLGSIAPQFIPFGMRVFITENIGLNAEIGIGAPHYASAGLCIRL